jgi:hypothetical protein
MQPGLMAVALQVPGCFHDALAIDVAKALALPCGHAKAAGPSRMWNRHGSSPATNSSHDPLTAMACSFGRPALAWDCHVAGPRFGFEGVSLAVLLGWPFLFSPAGLRGCNSMPTSFRDGKTV